MNGIPLAWQRRHFVDDFAGGQRKGPRCEVKLRVSLRFSPSSLNADAIGSGQPSPAMQSSELTGETVNVSETGVAISVSSSHIDHRYLNIVGCKLDLTLNLPTGPVQMEVTTRWFKRLLEEETPERYVIGMRITKMSDEEWVALVRYVHASL
ncbi:MAG TPA: PilZ domain-containing protein [Pyrinomonadaceae bacterium]|nr:PilZ domain-containing protein [Pyrinomonadaceae bacterium]